MDGPTPGVKPGLEFAARKAIALTRPVQVEAAEPGVIRTASMVLRALRAEDRAEFIRAVTISHAHLEPWIPIHQPGEADDAMFERSLRLASEGDASGRARRRVGVLPDGRIAGAFNLTSISWGMEFSAEATWWVAADQLGRGLGAEGLRAIVKHALSEAPGGLGLARVDAWIQRDNTRSVALASALGFVRSGEERSYLQTGAAWRIHDLYELRTLAE